MFLRFSGCLFILRFFNKLKRKIMKKNLLTLMFVIAIICVGSSVASAKKHSSPANSVAGAKKLLAANTRANSLRAGCNVRRTCGAELAMLFFWNGLYESSCAPNYVVGCSQFLENQVIGAGMAYEACLNNPLSSKNIDSNIDRNKAEKPQNVMSR